VESRGVPVLVLITAITTLWLGVRQANQINCNAEYNERSAASQQARAESAERDRAALEAFVRSLLDDTPGDFRAEGQRYLDTLESTKRERRDNPVPAPPADLCR
jgi:hypothetical protein